MRRYQKVLLGLGALTGVLGITTLLVFRLPQFGGTFDEDQLEILRQSPQYQGGRFENTPPQDPGLYLLETLKDYSGGQQREPSFVVPVVPLDPVTLQGTPAPGLRVYWLGHATTLVEIDGIRVMTDPVLSDYASPFEGFGPQRLHPAPIALAQMPRVDAIVISHDHYDHLDMATTQHFAAKGTHFYVGLGVGAHLTRWGVPAAQIHEMDWWDSLEISGVQIYCARTRHYSGRKGMDNPTLWAAWMVRGPEHSFYYSGDTGYGPHFAEARERLGAPDVSLLKIGAYGSTWLDIHMDPESAVKAHQDLGAKRMVPVHWATFNLSYHAWEEPIVRAVAAAAASGVELVTPAPGELVTAGVPFENRAWYLGGG